MTTKEQIDCVEGLIHIFERDTELKIKPFDRVFNATNCLKEIKKMLEAKYILVEKKDTCEHAHFDSDGCWCDKYNCLANCVGNSKRCMKDYIS